MSKENRTHWDDTKLGIVFGFFGGYCNAAALTILLYEISPMSANWGGMAKAAGNMHLSDVFTYIPLILCFIGGAFTGAKWAKKGDPFAVVIAEAILLISVAFLAKGSALLAIGIGGMAMGLQNGMTTQISHHKVRTSHLTSTVTDIGISLARKDYKDVVVKGSKALTFMWGAVLGALKASLLGNMAFAICGMYLLSVTIALHVFLPKCASCLKRDSWLAEWFTRTNTATVTIPTEH